MKYPGNTIAFSHFGGKDVKITTALYSLAAQENNDGDEGNLMQKAADYITWLEEQLEFSDRQF